MGLDRNSEDTGIANVYDPFAKTVRKFVLILQRLILIWNWRLKKRSMGWETLKNRRCGSRRTMGSRKL
jgi:hypothetical protein